MLREQKRMPSRVLIIEDDKDISHLVELHLRDTGCEVSPAFDGNAGLEQALSKS
jgi:two-component system alkaline phosphatase synthesis response regulator PhoP